MWGTYSDHTGWILIFSNRLTVEVLSEYGSRHIDTQEVHTLNKILMESFIVVDNFSHLTLALEDSPPTLASTEKS